jgi:hypothetical protein
MKTITITAIFLTCIIYCSYAQIQAEAFESIIPKFEFGSNQQLPYSHSVLMIASIDSNEYKLDSVTTSQIDVQWIQSISVNKNSEIKEKYGSRDADGVIIIQPKVAHIDDFTKLLDINQIQKIE